MSAMQRLLLGLALGLAALLAASAAQAACGSILISCACTASTAGANFGAYDPTSATPDQATASVTVTCVLGAAIAGSYTIGLTSGSSGSFSTRTLKNGSARLNYNLFVDSGHTEIWGDGTGGTQIVTGSFPLLTLLVNTQNFTVYGDIPARQNVPAGAYSDTLMVTVTY